LRWNKIWNKAIEIKEKEGDD